MKRYIYVYGGNTGYAPQIFSLNGPAVLEVEVNEPLETLLKNGCRLVSKTDLPKPLEPEVPAVSPKPPKTPQELCNLLTCLSTARFGTIVDQLQDAGCVGYAESRSLYSHLVGLAQECDKLLPKLPGSPQHTLSLVNGPKGERT